MTSQDLKIGDKVVIIGKYNDYIETVKNITPAGNIRLSGGALYDPTGRIKNSDPWDTRRIEICSEERETEIKQKNFTAKVLKVMQSTKSITYDQALQIAAILNQSYE